MIINSIYMLIATFSFSILGNVRGKNLIFSSLGGGITWFFYLFSLHYLPNSTIFCCFVASVFASIYSEMMARVLKTPATTFIIYAIIPLVPGWGMYTTMLQSIKGHINESLSAGLNTLEIAGTIAVGIFLISSIFKAAVLFRRKLFENKRI